MLPSSRRALLALTSSVTVVALLALGTALPASAGERIRYANLRVPAQTDPALEPARDALERILGENAGAFDLVALPDDGDDRYEVTSKRNHVRIAATDPATAVAAANAYLGTVGQSVSWNVRNIDTAAPLPLPAAPIRARSNVEHRFYGNDTEDGYTG